MIKGSSFPGKHIVAAVLMLVMLGAGKIVPVTAADGIDPNDPMVRITSAPIDKDVRAILANLSRDVTRATGIEEKFITYYWQTFDAIHCMGKASKDKPIFVDLYVPGFFTDEQVAGLMTAIAESLSKHSGIGKDWVFIHTHFPLQGQVYISGHVEHWENYRGAKAGSPKPVAEPAPK
jgi:hypothetical protein